MCKGGDGKGRERRRWEGEREIGAGEERERDSESKRDSERGESACGVELSLVTLIKFSIMEQHSEPHLC